MSKIHAFVAVNEHGDGLRRVPKLLAYERMGRAMHWRDPSFNSFKWEELSEDKRSEYLREGREVAIRMFSPIPDSKPVKAPGS